MIDVLSVGVGEKELVIVPDKLNGVVVADTLNLTNVHRVRYIDTIAKEQCGLELKRENRTIAWGSLLFHFTWSRWCLVIEVSNHNSQEAYFISVAA